MKERTRVQEISALAVTVLAILFALSLSFHNHAFNIGIVGEKISQAKPTNLHISNEFCSGCRFNGKFKPQELVCDLDYKLSEILIGFLNFNIFIPSSSIASKKSPRSPPAI